MPALRSRRYLIIAVLAALEAALVACGGAAASSGATNGVAGAVTVHSGAVVKLRATPYGKVLVDRRGRTLYLYTPDRRNTSVCYGQCASFWPPLLTSGKARAGAGVKGKLLGTTMRKNGTHQVTYAGHPLYFFANDTKAGQTNGQALQGIWWVVSAKGAKVTRKAAAAAAPGSGSTTTPQPGYGGGY